MSRGIHREIRSSAVREDSAADDTRFPKGDGFLLDRLRRRAPYHYLCSAHLQLFVPPGLSPHTETTVTETEFEFVGPGRLLLCRTSSLLVLLPDAGRSSRVGVERGSSLRQDRSC